MHEIFPVARTLLLNEDSQCLDARNDDTYKRYERMLRSYFRMA